MAEAHKVGILYKGVNGKISSFDSTSVADAFSRLEKIGGFSRTQSDDLAEQMAAALGSGDVRKARIINFRKNAAVPTNPDAAYRVRKQSDNAKATEFECILEIETGDYGHVLSILYGKVKSDGNGGIVVTPSRKESGGEGAKKWAEMYKNIRTMWDWYGRYGQFYRG